MTIEGVMMIGGGRVRGNGAAIRSIAAADHVALDPPFGTATQADVEHACVLADAALDTFRAASYENRARLLDTIADEITAIGDVLIRRAMAETGLPRSRLEGERGRTCGQLRMFADVVRAGTALDLRIDPALPDRQPAPRPDLRLRNVPIGPVAVFSASNFPLAFSIAGGDTASALAAGCPVVAKAHPAHPGTSELVGRAVQAAVAACGLPDGVFAMLYDADIAIGQALVADHRIKAVGFTGSRRGGLALLATAQARREPIPVFAEMSSINPVLMMPHALERDPGGIAKAFVGALTLGAGQFCTNPGLVLAIAGDALDRFTEAAAEALSALPAATMLTPGILAAYRQGLDDLAAHAAVTTVARGPLGSAVQGQAGLFSCDADAFVGHPELQGEIFGAAALIVRCRDLADVRRVLVTLEGQLTAALHLVEADHNAVQGLLPLLERKVGRILVNGFGTGVEVAHSMVHGGPFPATADGRSTSVGSLAIRRFLRPLCYQDLPDSLLPLELRADNPLAMPRSLDGALPAR